MPKNFYYSAIFFTGVYLLVNCFLFIISSFQMGERILELQLLSNLHVLQLLMLLVWSLILLKYYHYKQYWFPFWVVVVSIAAYIFQSLLLRYFLVTMELSVYYYLSTYLVLGMGVLYGISLIFSAAGEKLWLKAAGIFMTFSGLAMVSVHIWKMNSLDVRTNGTAEEIEQWIFLISSLSLLFFILNFRSEKEKAEEERISRQQTLVGAMNAVGAIALLSTFFIGIRAVNESKWILDHPNHVPEYLEKIVEPFEARTYVNSHGDSLRYRLMKPLDYDSMDLYPLVISLHGSGARGTDNAKQIAGTLMPQILSKQKNREKYRAFLFVPQCPFNSWWGGSSGHLKVDALVIECMLDLGNKFAIDENRRYLTGFSMGGYGTWHLISTRPELFAAAVPIAGAGNPAFAPNMVAVPVWAFHGAKDGSVPVSGSRDMIEAIKKAGGDPRYTEYPDKAHNLKEQLTNTPELLDWLFSQKRE